jgi:hypothetical protein
VFKARQDVAFPHETLCQVLAQPRERRQLQGDVALVGPIGPLRKPHLCHATDAQFADQLVGADAFTGLQRARAERDRVRLDLGQGREVARTGKQRMA